MSDKYSNAPLVYVTASIRTSALPKLTKDQTANIEQSLIKKGFIHSALGISTTFTLGQMQAEGIKEASTLSDVSSEETRKAFFSEDKITCLIIDTHGFEWRTSNYSKYPEFRKSFSELLKMLISLVDSFGSVVIQELTLSYSDIIAPMPGRKLSDYFARDSHILPLSFFERFTDHQQAGILQVNRVTKPNERINILLEQLPTSDGKVTKLLPDIMLEPEKDFGMPIRVKDEWSKNIENRKYYALLLTQASSLVTFKLEQYFKIDLFESIHDLTSKTFKSLINKVVCDVDWQNTNTDKKHG